MMPSQFNTSNSTQVLEATGMKEVLISNSLTEIQKNPTMDSVQSPQTLSHHSSVAASNINSDSETCALFLNCNNCELIDGSNFNDSHIDDCNDITGSIMSLALSESYKTKSIRCISPAQSWQIRRKTVQELESLSLKKLSTYLEKLSHEVEEISSELVQLLLENDALQQETDARNIAIEQLLKLTIKNPENELKPVQMSVILPSDEHSEEDD